MSSRTESAEHYQKALKAGKKAQKQMIHQGLYPHLPILDEILPEYPTAIQEELGIIEIPADKIVGTKTRGRADAFAANFMPLIPDKSEFAMKWQNLCQYHLGDSGIRDPIFCYEFLGRFYVQEGNKRVSVLKYFDAASITGTGNGISVLELVNAFQKVNGIELPYVIGPRRDGDLPAFWADAAKAKELLGWEAVHTVEDMCRSSWQFAKNASI